MTETTRTKNGALYLGLGALALLLLGRNQNGPGYGGGSGGPGSGDAPPDTPAILTSTYGTIPTTGDGYPTTSPYAHYTDTQNNNPPDSGTTRQSDPSTLNEYGGPAPNPFMPLAPIATAQSTPLIRPGTDRYELATREYFTGTDRPIAYDRSFGPTEPPVDFKGGHLPPSLPAPTTPNPVSTASFGLTPAPFAPRPAPAPVSSVSAASPNPNTTIRESLSRCDDAICKLSHPRADVKRESDEKIKRAITAGNTYRGGL